MSTHAAIIEKLADGTYRGIYCQADDDFDVLLEQMGFLR